MTHGILCATDFSEASRDVVMWSVRFAQSIQSHLTILYAFRIFKANGDAVEMKKKMFEDATRKFEALEKEVLAGSGIAYDFKIEIGFVGDRIEEHIKKNNLSFLVMGRDMSIDNREQFYELIDRLRKPLVIIP